MKGYDYDCKWVCSLDGEEFNWMEKHDCYPYSGFVVGNVCECELLLRDCEYERLWNAKYELEHYCSSRNVTNAFFVSKNGFYLWDRASHAVKRVSDVFTYQTMKVCKEMHESIIKDQDGPDKCMSELATVLKLIMEHYDDERLSELYSQKGVRW